MNIKSILSSIAAGSVLASIAIAQSPTYKVVDLGSVGPNGQPFQISKNGMVAGVAQVGDVLHAGLRSKGRVVDLGHPGLGGQNSMAFGVNAFGQVVGEAQTASP